MSKYLSKNIFEELRYKKTSNGFSLEHAINSGIENPDSFIGIYAGDEESYTLFASLLDPIIKQYHGFSKDDKHISNLKTDDLKADDLDINNKYIISTRIRVARNLHGFALGTIISNTQRELVCDTISKALSSFSGELSGTFYPIDGMSIKNKKTLIKDHFLFKEGDRFLHSAGLNRNWPKSRGIYHNDDKTFLTWVNEEDHLRIISMQKGGNIKDVFSRLVLGIKELEKHVEFSYSDHLGYITSCPTNLGTALRASVHIKLPNLSKNMQLFKDITTKHHLQIRGMHGEHSSSKGNIYDISNKRRLGVTEVQCVQDMYDGVLALIKAEEDL